MHFAILSLLGIMSCFLVWCGQVMPQPPIDGVTGSSTVITGTSILSTGTNVMTSNVHTWKDLSASSLRANGIHREGDVVVTNIEQIPYAIALPLAWFKEEFDESYPRAQHVFVSKDPNSHESISVQGLIVDSEDEFTLQQKFEWMQNDMRESGLNPTDGQVNEAKNYFIINGELPNLPNQMYTDIYFYFACDGGSRFTDSVAVSMVYNKVDAAKWQEQSKFIQQAGVQHVCE